MEEINYMEYGAYLLMILVVFLIIYIPKKSQENKIKQLQSSVKPGDKIVTYCGLFGKILSIEENKVILEIEPDNIKIAIDKWSICRNRRIK